MDTLENFFHLRAFTNNKLFRMLALCIVVALLGALAPFANAVDFRFTVTADNRPNSEVPGAFQQVLSQITQNVVDEGQFHISAGDIDPPSVTYDALKSEFGDDVKWYPVVGNHELDDEDYMQWLENYYDPNSFVTPPNFNPGPSGCPKTTYSFDYENAHFVVLNVYCDLDGNNKTDGDIPPHLYEWLETDLTSTSKDHIFVFGHEPAFPQNAHLTDSLNKYPNNRNQFWDKLESKGVTAYICGHTHWDSRYQIPDGQVWQIDVGAAGVNYGHPPADYLVFLDVTISDHQVQFDVWHGEESLLFTPVTPCRIVDTRLQPPQPDGNPIPPGGLRSYEVYGNGATIGSQGGNPAGCPSPQGEPRAAHLSVAAVPVAGAGHLRLFPFNLPTPNASALSYKTGSNIANAVSVKTCYLCTKDVNIKSFVGTTHVVMDIMGYYYPETFILHDSWSVALPAP